MRYRRADVVERALAVLDRYGLADLTVRRLAAELGLQPSALYHHFSSKQALLAAVAEEVLVRGPVHPRPPDWAGQARAVCRELREAMLAYRDGAEVVATVHAFGLGVQRPGQELTRLLQRAGCEPALAGTAARTLLHFVLGHAGDEQTHLQAGSAGAIGTAAPGPDEPDRSDFDVGLDLVLAGIATHLPPTGGDAARAQRRSVTG